MVDRLNLTETSRLLNLHTREVLRRAERGELVGIYRQGQWEFRREDLREYLQREMPGYSDRALADLDARLGEWSPLEEGLLLSSLLHPEGMALPLTARSKAGVLRELVEIGEHIDLVWDKPALLAAVEEREALCSTGVGLGVALPHPRRMPPYAVAESFIVFGRAQTPIPYGSIDGGMVDLFFLVCATDESIHLHALAHLCRLARRPEVLAVWRQASTALGVVEHLRTMERELAAR